MSQIRRDSITSIALALAIETGSVSATLPPPPVIITVTSTADTFAIDGVCTLREAISSAALGVVPGGGTVLGECAVGGAAPAVDAITFQIPDGDTGCVGSPKVCTIKPGSAFPQITEPVVIDGYSQAGSKKNALAVGDDAVLLIELDATNVSPALWLAGAASGGSTIQGLAITHLASVGIQANGSAGNKIVGNFIGVDVAGTASSFNGTSFAVDLESGSNGATIGGSTSDARNLLSGNDEIVYVTGCSNTVVQGNYINIDRNGTASLQQALRGIDLTGAGNGNLIGGSATGAGNVIGIWGAFGIVVQTIGNSNLVQGNLVGSDATGTIRLGGGQIAVGYLGTGTGNKIGGTAAGEGNLIAGATVEGVYLGGTSTDLLVQGNVIGTDISGTIPLGNASGIVAETGSGMIGGTTAGAGNRVAFNSSLGASVISGAHGWAILGNDIYANGSLGISLSGGPVPTPNDDGDMDTGSNNLQNYPVISTVAISPSTTAHVSGSLNSAAGTAFRIEFFANANCAGSGHGQGKVFIGIADNVMTDPTGNVNFGTPLTLNFTVPAQRHVVTATATDPAGNTSEFSACGDQDSIFTDGLEGD